MIFSVIKQYEGGIILSFSEWIGVIGGITGIISICVQIAAYNANRMHVKTDTFDELLNRVYVSEKDDIVKCYLNLQVINTGNKPFVLQDVYMCRPKISGNTGGEFIHYKKALSKLNWDACNDDKSDRQESIHLPVSVPAGGVFEASFLFVDFMQDCYKSDAVIIQPTLVAYFAPSKIKKCKVQAILTDTDSGQSFAFHDEDGNVWNL